MVFNYLLSAIFLVPLGGALLTYPLAVRNQERARFLALIISLIVLALTMIAALIYMESVGVGILPGTFWADIFPAMNDSAYNTPEFTMVMVDQIPWVAGKNSVGISYFLGMDGLSIPLVILSGFITVVAILASPKDTDRAPVYFMLILMLETGIMGVFLALDFFLFFIAWELVLVPMFFLIGIWGGPKREYAAIYFFIYTHVASLILLLGIVGLWVEQLRTTGTASFSMLTIAGNLGQAPVSALTSLTFFFLLFGFIVKVPSVPFHTWLPLAHVEAPAPISMILAGVLLKLGGYGLIRVNFQILPGLFKQNATLIAIIGLVSLFWGGFVALRQTDIKRLIALSSVAHMGMVLFGVAITAATGRPEGIIGAMVMMIAHGIISPALFNLAGVIQHSTETREIDSLKGLTQKMPTIAFLLVFFSMASLGLPGLAGFVSEFYVFLGAFGWMNIDLGGDWPILAFIAVFGIVITVGFYLWMLQRVIWGNASDTISNAQTPHRWEYSSLVLLAIPTLLLGIFPFILLTPINETFVALADLVKDVVL